MEGPLDLIKDLTELILHDHCFSKRSRKPSANAPLALLVDTLSSASLVQKASEETELEFVVNQRILDESSTLLARDLLESRTHNRETCTSCHTNAMRRRLFSLSNDPASENMEQLLASTLPSDNESIMLSSLHDLSDFLRSSSAFEDLFVMEHERLQTC
eukprot:scaffold1829_cov194-Ochromonas_danica.AAC.8